MGQKQIKTVTHDLVYETSPASTTLTIIYVDGTEEQKLVCGENEYSPYRKYIQNPYPHHMG